MRLYSKSWTIFAIVYAILIPSLVGCQNHEVQGIQTEQTSSVETSTVTAEEIEVADTKEDEHKLAQISQEEANNADLDDYESENIWDYVQDYPEDPNVYAKEEEISIELPEGVTGVLSATKKYPELEDIIINTYKIPSRYWNETRYYYNEIDLNADGINEYFIVIFGEYTDKDNKHAAMIATSHGGLELAAGQSFYVEEMPIYISNNFTNGMKDIIVSEYEKKSNATKYIVYQNEKGKYVAQKEKLDSVSHMKGAALICDDLQEGLNDYEFLTIGS